MNYTALIIALVSLITAITGLVKVLNHTHATPYGETAPATPSHRANLAYATPNLSEEAEKATTTNTESAGTTVNPVPNRSDEIGFQEL